MRGVDYYNDSKATNVDSTMKAIESFPWPHSPDPRRQGQEVRLHHAAAAAARACKACLHHWRRRGEDRGAHRRRGRSGACGDTSRGRCQGACMLLRRVTSSCWPRPAPASTSSKITSSAAGSSKRLWRQENQRKGNSRNGQARRGGQVDVLCHPAAGALRAGHGFQLLGRHGKGALRLPLQIRAAGRRGMRSQDSSAWSC